jgi:hypothetical protein
MCVFSTIRILYATVSFKQVTFLRLGRQRAANFYTVNFQFRNFLASKSIFFCKNANKFNDLYEAK